MERFQLPLAQTHHKAQMERFELWHKLTTKSARIFYVALAQTHHKNSAGEVFTHSQTYHKNSGGKALPLAQTHHKKSTGKVLTLAQTNHKNLAGEVLTLSSTNSPQKCSWRGSNYLWHKLTTKLRWRVSNSGTNSQQNQLGKFYIIALAQTHHKNSAGEVLTHSQTYHKNSAGEALTLAQTHHI